MWIYKGLEVYKGYIIEYWTDGYIVKHNGKETFFKRKRDAREYLDTVDSAVTSYRVNR